MLFPLVKNTLSPSNSKHSANGGKAEPLETYTYFHDRYGDAVLVGGVTFHIAIWTYTATQTGIE